MHFIVASHGSKICDSESLKFLYNLSTNDLSSIQNQGSLMALDVAKKQEIIAMFARDSQDTGSSEVQVALLTQRIVDLTEHLKTNPKDHSSRLGLLKLVGQRKSLLSYLKRTRYESYIKLISQLKLKDR